jgi:hypothetical protein
MKNLVFVLCAAMIVATSAQGTTQITDGKIFAAFAAAIAQAGYNCPQVVAAKRLDYQDERGQPFMVACSGSAKSSYRVTVKPRGATLIEPWK